MREAVIAPFLKAYSKKKGEDPPLGPEDVYGVTVDSEGQTKLKELELMELEYDEAGAGRPVTDGQAGRCASSKSDPCLCPGPWLYP